MLNFHESALAAQEADQVRRREAGVAEREKQLAEQERQATEQARRVDELRRKDAELIQREERIRGMGSSLPRNGLSGEANDARNRPVPQSLQEPEGSTQTRTPQTLTKVPTKNEHLERYKALSLYKHSIDSCDAEFGSWMQDKVKILEWLRAARQQGISTGVTESEFEAVKGKIAADPVMAAIQLVDDRKSLHLRKKDCEGLSLNIGLMDIAQRSNGRQ